MADAKELQDNRLTRRPYYALKEDLLEAFQNAPKVDYARFRSKNDAHVDQSVHHPFEKDV